MWNFFDDKYCLTLDPAEWNLAQKEFHRVGLYNVRKFDAIPDVGPHQSFNRSSRRMLIDFFGAGNQRLLILEDDAEFRQLDHLSTALYELPSDWDIVYLGANIQDAVPERYTTHLSRVRNAWTTHAIGYNRQVLPFLLENMPGVEDRMYDNWLGSVLPDLKAFVVNPMVAWQRPRYSVIWGKTVDYSDAFVLSQEKLNGRIPE
jgi:hypothetical protein